MNKYLNNLYENRGLSISKIYIVKFVIPLTSIFYYYVIQVTYVGYIAVGL